MEENNRFKSWWRTPRLTREELNYIKSIESVFKVKNANKQWIPYYMMPHQIDFHKNDVAIKGAMARDRVVVKSRNTSFTTSALISNLMAVPYYPNQEIPFVRLNEKRAYDLVNEAKEMIRNMTPVNIDGVAYPFNPKDVDLDAAGKIRFPNKVTFQAYPANAAAAENIRGLRIAGSAGMLDESNFMNNYNDIYISIRDAAAGYSLDGEKHFQMNIGTTLKGTVTPFALWFKKQQENPDTTVDIYKWEVFDPALFDVNKPPIDQPNLIPIVPWHNINDLNKKYLEDLKTFLEEYMAMVVDSDTQFYPSGLYDRCESKDLKIIRNPIDVGEYYMGVDVASVLDFFVISVFKSEPQEVEVQKINSYGEKVVEKEVQNFYKQVYLFYDRGKDLREMENILKEQIDIWLPLGLKKARIDSQGSGLQLYQNIKKLYHKQSPNLIENIPLGNIKKGNETIKMKEFVHTNQKKLMVYGNVKFIKDETQKMHYSMWDYDFNCERTKEYGHGDTTIANAYALLPLNFKGKKQYETILMAKEDVEIKDVENLTVREIVDTYNNMGLKDKIKILRKNKGY